HDPDSERIVGEAVDGADRGQRLDERTDEHGVRDRRESDLGAERPGDGEHDETDDDVGGAEGERRVLRNALVEDGPGGEPQPRLELADDADREEEQPDEESDRPSDEAAAHARGDVHPAYASGWTSGLVPLEAGESARPGSNR